MIDHNSRPRLAQPKVFGSSNECGLDGIRSTNRKPKKCTKNIGPNRKERYTVEDLNADNVKRHFKKV
jgi:hypothetical protein